MFRRRAHAALVAAAEARGLEVDPVLDALRVPTDQYAELKAAVLADAWDILEEQEKSRYWLGDSQPQPPDPLEG